ncbi:hypothetical protein MNBD_NITROSPINAE02-2178 [hydrothermal vent metagenome]|uniref:Polymerase nucleotidyl transferase domain-containing protein n=1 Tax=hydrothermal vent metagenome TaxID=652676 RepID=A0A3B1BH21_9ZZZZ
MDKETLKSYYGEWLAGLALYGSTARETADEDSDIDYSFYCIHPLTVFLNYGPLPISFIQRNYIRII